MSPWARSQNFALLIFCLSVTDFDDSWRKNSSFSKLQNFAASATTEAVSIVRCTSTSPIRFYFGRSSIWQSVRNAQSHLFIFVLYSVAREFNAAQHSSAIRATSCPHHIDCCSLRSTINQFIDDRIHSIETAISGLHFIYILFWLHLPQCNMPCWRSQWCF